MANIEDVIDYLKRLKRGFDIDDFKIRMSILAEIVEGPGMEYEDFHELFKVWLNLSIPIAKWKEVSHCVIPRERIEARTVHFAWRWLLTNYKHELNFSKIACVLDWLTAAMDTDSIDMESLNDGYQIFHMIFIFDLMASHVIKLLYTLSTPSDVTRRRVLALLQLAKQRNKCREVHALLGLFKSYKPECVPESVSAVSVQACAKKITPVMMHRFKRNQIRRNAVIEQPLRLHWANPINIMQSRGHGKRLPPLIPDVKYSHIGSTQYDENAPLKTFLDFTDTASLLEYGARCELSRPARVRALLLHESGAVLLTAAAARSHAFLNHDLDYLLTNCFLQDYPYSYEAKADLLIKLGSLQRIAQQGVPAVTAFLAQYLPFWNEMDHFSEILSLLEWLSVDPVELVAPVLSWLGRIFLRAHPLAQCAILRTLTNLYDNLAYASTKERQYFLNSEVSKNYQLVLGSLSSFISGLCNAALQANPDDLRLLLISSESLERMVRSSLRYRVEAPAPQPLLFSLAFLTPSAVLLEKQAQILLLYHQLLEKSNKNSGLIREEYLPTLRACTEDIVNALWKGQALTHRAKGVIFNRLEQQDLETVKKFRSPDQSFGLNAHLGLAPYTYVHLESHQDADEGALLESVIVQEFPVLARLIGKLCRG